MKETNKMIHYLNVCNIDGAKIEPVDVITFGSPCQDMSVAGKREGIKHSEQGDEETTRSGLFYEAARIIKEMRKATNGEYPKYAVWENVPGAFSSNKGWDFYAVLEALCSICDNSVSIPKPYDKRKPDKLVWNKSGEIVGDNYSLCWRTFDAQYWGVPQRRKRIYLVADFNTRCAREILFKSESLRGNLQKGIEARQAIANDVMGSVDGSIGSRIKCLAVDGYNQTTNDKCGSLRSGKADQDHVGCVTYSFDSLSSNSMKSSNPNSGCRPVEISKCIDTSNTDPSKNQGGIAIVQPVILNDQGGNSINAEQDEIAPTLRSQSHQHEPVIAYDMYNQKADGVARTLKTPVGGDDLPVICCEPGVMSRCGGHSYENVSGTLRANAGDNQPVVAFTQNQREEVRDLNDVAGSLAAEPGIHQQTYVCEPAIALQANGINRADTAGCNGKGWNDKTAYTLNTIDRHAVCFVNRPHVRQDGKSETIRSECNGDTPCVAFENNSFGGYKEGCGTLKASGGDYGGGSENLVCLGVDTSHADDVVRVEETVSLQSRDYKGGKNICYGVGNGQADQTYLHEKMRALNCMHDQQAVMVENHPADSRVNLDTSGTCQTLTGRMGTGGGNTPMCLQNGKPPRKYIIRRLIPTECARLQGFPDWWSELTSFNPDDAEFWEDVRRTHAEINDKKYKPCKDITALEKWYNKLHTDSAEYKMWGNGIALPNAVYVLQGVAEQGAKTLGSLFDGSGGFPLAGAINGIEPKWASEIEPYPIAVTMSRFTYK